MPDLPTPTAAPPTTAPGTEPASTCCSGMAAHLTPCLDHASAWQCVDAAVVRFKDGGLGLPVRDGRGGRATSAIAIDFCPWCGAKLA